MTQISYFDFSTKEGLDEYCRKAYTNVKLFERIFRTSAENLCDSGFEIPDANKELIKNIANITGLSIKTVEGINCGDEALDLNGGLSFGCTAIAKNGCVGQTLDFFTVELALVREADCLYITMPPYLCLIGMNQNLAFCTNYIGGKVQSGIPISHLRRNILRHKTITEVLDYLNKVEKTSPANFLLCDPKHTIDIESCPKGITKYEEECFAHTNHILNGTIFSKEPCARLQRAGHLLKNNDTIEHILEDNKVKVPITKFAKGTGFGSIIQVIMDTNKKEIKYKDSHMKEYEIMRV